MRITLWFAFTLALAVFVGALVLLMRGDIDQTHDLPPYNADNE